MTFWFIFIVIVFLCFAPINIGGIRHSHIRKLIGFTVILFVTLFRFDVGYDYAGYYKNMYPFFDYASYMRLEPFGKLFMNISGFYNSPQLFFILYGIVTFSCLIFAFTHFSKNIFITVLFYLAFFYLPGLSTIRQEAAVSIILAGYIFIKKNKPILYVFTCVFASMFHLSGLMALLFYPFLKINNIRSTIIITIGIIAGLGIFMNIILTIPTFEAYYHYIEDSDNFKGGSIIRYLYLIIAVVLFLLSYYQHRYELIRLSSLSLIGCSITFVLGGHIGGRTAEYFTIFLCIVASNVLSNGLKKYTMPIGLCLSILFMSNIYISTKNPTKQPYTPYQSILLVDLKNPRFK